MAGLLGGATCCGTAWHESKGRFFYTLIGMVLMCGLFVLSYESWHVDPARYFALALALARPR